MKTKWKSNLLLLMTAMIWGFAFVAQRLGAEHVGALTFNGIRFALGALSMIPVLLLFGGKRPQGEERKQTVYAALAGGCALFLASALQQWGVQITGSAGKAGFITGLYTVLVPVIGVLFLHRKTGLFIWIGAVTAVVGLYLLSMTGYEKPGIGDLVLIAGAIVWAMHILIIDHFNQKGIHSFGFAFGQYAVCAVLTLIGALFFEDISLTGIQAAGIPILYGGIMSVGVAYTLQILGQKNADPTAASIILSMESMFSALGGAVLLNEKMTPGGYLGCLLIFAGIIFAQLPERRRGKTF